jgi:C-terminal processing protease CtpA/Prc
MFPSKLRAVAAALLAGGALALAAAPAGAQDKGEKEPPAKSLDQRIRELEDELTRLRQARVKELDEEIKKAEEAAAKAREDFSKAVQAGDQAAAAKAQEAIVQASNDRSRLTLERVQLESRIRTATTTTPGFGRTDEQRLGLASAIPNATLADQLDLPERQGRVIERVDRDSPAAKAGLQPHDVLVEIDGKAVPRATAEYRRFLGTLKTDAPLDAIVVRQNKKQTIKGLTLPSR